MARSRDPDDVHRCSSAEAAVRLSVGGGKRRRPTGICFSSPRITEKFVPTFIPVHPAVIRAARGLDLLSAGIPSLAAAGDGH